MVKLSLEKYMVKCALFCLVTGSYYIAHACLELAHQPKVASDSWSSQFSPQLLSLWAYSSGQGRLGGGILGVLREAPRHCSGGGKVQSEMGGGLRGGPRACDEAGAEREVL